MEGNRLRERIAGIGRKAGFTSVALAVYDYETQSHFSIEGDRWFHAASTIKVAILLALFKTVEEGRVKLENGLHVRNRFLSLVEGIPFRLDPGRDADPEIYRRLGRTMRISELAEAMIVRSSNLATNLLVDYLSEGAVVRFLCDAGIVGVNIKRGVEDRRASELGVNNEVTANGLVQLFRILCEEGELNAKNREQVLKILLAQELNSMLPALLPAEVRIAHKTGEISTACHDAGIVFVPGRKPYVVAILTECDPALEGRQKALAAMSLAVYTYITGQMR